MNDLRWLAPRLTVLIVGLVALNGCSADPTPSAIVTLPSSATPTATQSPGTSSSEPAEAVRTPQPIVSLAAGIHTTDHQSPALTYTVPDGWSMTASDDPAVALISPRGDSITLYWDAYPGTVDGGVTCGLPSSSADQVSTVDWSVPHSADALVTSLKRRHGWSGAADQVSLGGLNGWRIDGSFTATGCTYAYALNLASSPLYLGQPGTRYHLYALNDGDGHTIVVSINHRSVQSTDDQFVNEAKSVIKSFMFTNDQPTPEPTEAPAPTPSPAPAGSYMTSLFTPSLAFALPEGWTFNESGEGLTMTPVSNPANSINVFWNAYPVDSYRCAAKADIRGRIDWSTGHTARDLVDSITARSDWSGQHERTTLGRNTGWFLDGTIHTQDACWWLWTVPDANREPAFGGPDDAGRFSVYVMDDGVGGTILVSVVGDEDFLADAQSVNGTFAFEGNADVCAGAGPGTASPAPTPPADEDLVFIESKFWPIPDFGYRYQVRLINHGPAVTARAYVTLFDACGRTYSDSVSLGDLDSGELGSGLGDLTNGFVPVRMEVRLSQDQPQAP